MTKSYSELVAQAESAVSVVKDAELRRVAFEKILDDLLASASAAASMPSRATTGHRTGGSTRARSSNIAAGGESKSARTGTTAYIEELIGEEFFSKPKTISEVKAELGNRGHHIPMTSLSGPLQRLCQKRRLRRQKTDDEGKKKAFAYSHW
jgi:membrane protein involved in colicin uptake